MKTKNILKTTYAVWLILFAFASLGGIHCAKEDLPPVDDPDGDPALTLDNEGAVMAAKEKLEIGYGIGNSAERVTENITLPSAGVDGVNIFWESDNSDVINTKTPGVGIVTPSNNADTEVTLTATLTKNDAMDTKDFTLNVVNVVPRISDRVAVMMETGDLAIGYADGDSAGSVTRNITLPLMGTRDDGEGDRVSITWASDNPTIINVKGILGVGRVNRPGNNTDVTLTATLTKNDAMDTKDFTLTVIMSDDPAIVPMYPYVCENGTTAPGTTAIANTEKCVACDADHGLQPDGVCVRVYPYSCMNGTHAPGTTTVEGTQKCMACDTDHGLQPDETCVRVYPYSCMNGTAASGTTTVEGTQKCMACDTGYGLQPDETCQQVYSYICTNGTAASGATTVQNTEKCTACNTGYDLAKERCMETVYDYTCMNGTPASGTTTVENTEKCASCNSPHVLADGRCLAEDTTVHPYVCTNGTAASGMTATENTQKCMACNTGYVLQPDETCQQQVYPYVCTNGDAFPGLTTVENTEKCFRCNSPYNLENGRCVEITCFICPP